MKNISTVTVGSHDCDVIVFPHTSPQPSAFEEKAVEKVDDLLESYMGIRDTELGEWGHLGLGVGRSSGEGASRSCGAAICASILLPVPVQRPPWWNSERTKRTRMSWLRRWTRGLATSPSLTNLSLTSGVPSGTPRSAATRPPAGPLSGLAWPGVSLSGRRGGHHGLDPCPPRTIRSGGGVGAGPLPHSNWYHPSLAPSLAGVPSTPCPVTPYLSRVRRREGPDRVGSHPHP